MRARQEKTLPPDEESQEEENPLTIYDAYDHVYRVRAVLRLVERFHDLRGISPDDSPAMHPTDLSYLMDLALDHVKHLLDVFADLEHPDRLAEDSASRAWQALRRRWRDLESHAYLPAIRCVALLGQAERRQGFLDHLAWFDTFTKADI